MASFMQDHQPLRLLLQGRSRRCCSAGRICWRATEMSSCVRCTRADEMEANCVGIVVAVHLMSSLSYERCHSCYDTSTMYVQRRTWVTFGVRGWSTTRGMRMSARGRASAAFVADASGSRVQSAKHILVRTVRVTLCVREQLRVACDLPASAVRRSGAG